MIRDRDNNFFLLSGALKIALSWQGFQTANYQDSFFELEWAEFDWVGLVWVVVLFALINFAKDGRKTTTPKKRNIVIEDILY